jgi:hypothetical protein
MTGVSSTTAATAGVTVGGVVAFLGNGYDLLKGKVFAGSREKTS